MITRTHGPNALSRLDRHTAVSSRLPVTARGSPCLALCTKDQRAPFCLEWGYEVRRRGRAQRSLTDRRSPTPYSLYRYAQKTAPSPMHVFQATCSVLLLRAMVSGIVS